MPSREAGAVATTLRLATRADVPALDALIAASARELSAGYYSPAQIAGAVRHVFGVDTTLVDDGTYYVITDADGLAAAGGWSRRRTLFGSDSVKHRSDGLLDPATEPARIRAFFVHPSRARRGLARRLYATCEEAARGAGFSRFDLVATRPGEPLYRALGFTAVEPVIVPLPGGLELPCTWMTRVI